MNNNLIMSITKVEQVTVQNGKMTKHVLSEKELKKWKKENGIVEDVKEEKKDE